MTTKEISLCKNFHCLGPACPRNCCRGWHIPVDDATVDRYKSLPGTEGRSVRSFLTRRRGLIVFRRIFGTCPFLNSDRLCQFQANGAPELMPLVCRYYPREIITYSDYTEITLSLSCISAARLFVERPERNAWADAPGAEPFWDVANDDADFLAFLLKDREKIQDYIWREDLSLEQIWAGLYAYIAQEHAAIMRDRLEDLAEIELEDGREESGSEKTAAAGTYEAGPAGDDGEGGRVGPAPNLAFFPITVLDRMILNHIDYGMLLLREPKFASLIMKYNKLFKGLFVDTADEEFSEAVSLCHPLYGALYALRTGGLRNGRNRWNSVHGTAGGNPLPDRDLRPPQSGPDPEPLQCHPPGLSLTWSRLARFQEQFPG